MRFLLALAVGLTLSAAGFAQIYKWTDPSGKTHYGDQPPDDAKKQELYFAANGIRYREVNVETSESGRKEYEALGGGGVPIILIGEKVMRGFSPESFEYYRKKS